MMELVVAPACSALSGTVRVPSDKSMSHRAVLFAGMANGTSLVRDVLDSADVRSTISALHWLGAGVRVLGGGPRGLVLEITGWGDRGPTQPQGPVDCGNSGTTARLLMGVLAGWPVRVTLTGDSSLSRRPMRRVADPLRSMGARVDMAGDGTLPVTVHGARLSPVAYASPVASAQVKTAILLAGLRADGTTTVTEPAPSRDHTERMLPAFGVPVSREGSLRAAVAGPVALTAAEITVPADPSSAAFLAVAATLLENSRLVLPDVAVNPTRTGFLGVLERMGAEIVVRPGEPMGTEPIATLEVRSARSLRATRVPAEEVPSLIDEVPILALAAARAQGMTRFEGVGELRVKESDRLEAVRSGLEALGVPVRAGADWLEVTGTAALQGARLSSLGDHRLAMTWAVAGLLAAGKTVVDAFEAVDVSYPTFRDDVEALLGRRLT